MKTQLIELIKKWLEDHRWHLRGAIELLADDIIELLEEVRDERPKSGD